MNKHLTQSLKLFLLLVLILSSGCGPVTAIPSPTLTSAPSQTPTATLTPSPTNTPESIHPEGILVYLASGNVTTVNLQNQEAKTISTSAASYNISFQTLVVGNKIYVANNADEPSHGSEIIKISSDGTDIEHLLSFTDQYWPLYCGKMSPNKRYLLCYYEKGFRSIFVIDTVTKSIQTIPAKDNRMFQYISWSPDSQKIYLLDAMNMSSLNGVPVMGLYGQERLLEFSLRTNKLSELLPELSKPNVYWGYEPNTAGWSPSGTDLLINLACNSSSTEIIDHPYIFNVDEKTTMPIKVDGCISKFEWSPDSTKIAFENGDLFIYDIASENLQTIPVNGQLVFYFAWSPNGKYILFSSYSSPQNSGIYLLNVSDGSVVQIMPNKKYSYTYQADDFTWSPDGNMVLFRQWAQEVNGWDLYLLNADTKTVDRVERQVGDTWYFHQMRSPDGKYFIFVGGNTTRTIKIQGANNGEQIEIKVPSEIAPNTSDIYWMINNSVYYSGLWRN